MKANKISRKLNRQNRTRKKIKVAKGRSRLSVFKSNKHIYAQVIDDASGKTLVAASDVELKKANKSDISKNTSVKEAFEVGQLVAKKALDKKIKEVVFDRGSFRYQGVVKSLADGARKEGLKF